MLDTLAGVKVFVVSTTGYHQSELLTVVRCLLREDLMADVVTCRSGIPAVIRRRVDRLGLALYPSRWKGSTLVADTVIQDHIPTRDHHKWQ